MKLIKKLCVSLLLSFWLLGAVFTNNAFAFRLPEWRNLKKAAVHAFLTPETIVPLAVSIIYQDGDLNEDTSDWISERTLLFGSQANAQKASDNIKHIAYNINMSATLFLLTRRDVPTVHKCEALSLTVAANPITRETAGLIKQLSHRQRPNLEDFYSYPSGHTALTAVNLACTSLALRSLSISRGAKAAIRISCVSLTALEGWSRLEAKKHWPTDVLVGAALGNFLAVFFYDVFYSISGNQDIFLTFSPSKSESKAAINFRY